MTGKISWEHGGRFFSTFQKYISLTSQSSHCRQGLPSTFCCISRSHRFNKFYNSRTASTSTKLKKESLRPDNFYSVFSQTLPRGPPPTGPFRINISALRQEFLYLQSLAHPDRHQEASKARAEDASARINQAYNTLRSPLRRAEYILSLHDVQTVDDESAMTEDENLLTDVLEIREKIEDASTEDEIELLKDQNKKMMLKCEEDLARVLEDGDWLAGKIECARLRYWTGIRDALNNWEKGKPVVLTH